VSERVETEHPAHDCMSQGATFEPKAAGSISKVDQRNWHIWLAAVGLSIPFLVIAWASFIAGTRLHGSQGHDGLAPTAFTVWGFFLILAVAVPVGLLAEHNVDRRETDDCVVYCSAITEAFQKISESDPTLGGLAKANFQQMAKFTVIAQRQARMSYYASLVAAAVALAVLVAGTVTAVGLPDTRAWTALLTVIGASLSGFLTLTFVKTYEMASRQMSYYYGQPLVHCYLLHAEWLLSARKLYGDGKDPLLQQVISASLRAGLNAQSHLLTLQETDKVRRSRNSTQRERRSPKRMVPRGTDPGDGQPDSSRPQTESAKPSLRDS
jgi:hypothetical protein